jgi:hypothetical protein
MNLIKLNNSSAKITKALSTEDKEAIKEWLKKSLTIKVDMSYDSSSVDVDILLDGEKLASGRGSKYSQYDTGPR